MNKLALLTAFALSSMGMVWAQSNLNPNDLPAFALDKGSTIHVEGDSLDFNASPVGDFYEFIVIDPYTNTIPTHGTRFIDKSKATSMNVDYSKPFCIFKVPKDYPVFRYYVNPFMELKLSRPAEYSAWNWNQYKVSGVKYYFKYDSRSPEGELECLSTKGMTLKEVGGVMRYTSFTGKVVLKKLENTENTQMVDRKNPRTFSDIVKE